MLEPDELRVGLEALGISCSDKEFNTLKTEVLREGDDGRFKLTDVLPCASTYTALCEADDFVAIKQMNELCDSNTNLTTSSVLYPEMPQAKVLSKKERKENIASASLVETIRRNDVNVMRAWETSEKSGCPSNIKEVLSNAGIQVSERDAIVLSRNLEHREKVDMSSGMELSFRELCRGIGIKSNIKEIRTDSRTGKDYLRTQKVMKSSQGVVREHEELPGGILATLKHRPGSVDAAFRNNWTSNEVLQSLYHADTFDKRVWSDSRKRLAHRNRRSHIGADLYGGEHYMSNAFTEQIVEGNKRRSPTPELNVARDHLSLGSMQEVETPKLPREQGGSQLSPDLVGNKKGITAIGVESRIGSEENTMISKGYARKDEEGRASPSPFKAFPIRQDGDKTSHGNPISRDENAVAVTPNKRRGPPKHAKWAGSSMRDFITLSGAAPQGVSSPSKAALEGQAEGSSSGGPKRTLRRFSNSLASVPTFGPCAPPFATNTKGRPKEPLRPGSDGSMIVQNYFQNSRCARTPPPFAVSGENSPYPDPGGTGSRRGSKKYGLAEAQRYNIINNVAV